MISLSPAGGLRHVLCLGAHCDDIEIGCGGTLCALASIHPEVVFDFVVFSTDPVREPETRAALAGLVGSPERVRLHAHPFRDGFFPTEWAGIKQAFESLKALGTPDLVLTHFEHDRHQDHRVVSELTWNTFRNHLVLEYEIPKWDGDLGRPSVYSRLTSEIVDRKIATLMRSFPSQTGKRWFTDELFRSLLRLRGMECNSPSGYAEAFHARKIALAL